MSKMRMHKQPQERASASFANAGMGWMLSRASNRTGGNFSELIDKLNQSIQAADKNRVNEVRVDFLIEEVNRLKGNVEKLIQETA